MIKSKLTKNLKSRKCYLCHSRSFAIKNEKTRDKKHLRVLQCKKCGLTFLESFSHFNNLSYQKGEMYNKKIYSKAEYLNVLKAASRDDTRRFQQWKSIIKNKEVLDFGCGAGGFLKLARRIAKKVRGVEIDEITEFYQKQIEVKKDISEFKEKFDIVTLFHVLEHIPDPILFLKELKTYLKPKGMIIIEVPNDDDALISYYHSQVFKDLTYWSLHLYSYNRKSLSKICRRAGFRYVKIDFFQRYPLSNHIGWLKDGQPGGHRIYTVLNDDKLNELYKKILEKINSCDTLIAVLKS